MGYMKHRRLSQIFLYGWKDAGEISNFTDVKKSKIAIFIDILICFKDYYLFSNQYKKFKIWNLPIEERKELLSKIGKANRKRDLWIDNEFENRIFLKKFTSRKYQCSDSLIKKRLKAYTNRYHLGKNCILQYNVEFARAHELDGSLTVGEKVFFAKNVFIDYSGDVVISDNVKLSAGVTIESHRHEFTPGAKKYKSIPTKIVIEDGVWIGQQAIICENCKRIGRYAQIGAGAVVRNPIPPYAIVIGNPAKIVGFIFTPQEMREFEEIHFPNSLTDIEKYESDYNKLFINRLKDIKQQLKN